MFKKQEEKGITLITLAVTIIILTILAVSLVVGTTNTIKLQSYYDTKEDILNLSEDIKRYYLENDGDISKLKGLEVDFDTSSTEVQRDMNPNDKGNYYELNTYALETILNNEDNIYIFNEQTLTVYCKDGYKVNGITHYTAVDTFEIDDFASDYYESLNLPEISSVILESEGADKSHAGPGDTVYLKLLSSVYDFNDYKTQPTITLTLGSNVLTKDSENNTGRIKTVKYTLPSDISANNTVLRINISGYSIDGTKVGTTITSPTFNEGVTYNSSTFPKVKVGQVAIKNSTINGSAPSSKNPVIPEGYCPIDLGDATWGDGTSEPMVDKGLVITDKAPSTEYLYGDVDLDGDIDLDDANLVIDYRVGNVSTLSDRAFIQANVHEDDDIDVDDSQEISDYINGFIDKFSIEVGNEWIWVPVDSGTLNSMYTEVTTAENLSGSTGVTTKRYSLGNIINNITRGKPNSTSYREPDILTSYDNNDNAVTAGFNNLTDMAQKMVNEYSEMIDSINQYGGFYIAKCELSSAGVKRHEATLVNKSWYELYKKCKDLTLNDKVKTRMIWGCQWDATCNWIATDTRYSITDSTSWGNYYSPAVTRSNSTTIIKAANKSTNLTTGCTTYTSAKNIFDLAGNYGEWTQEASSSTSRMFRGGYYSNSTGSAADRTSATPTTTTYGYVRYSSYPNSSSNQLIIIE